jgi:hypothetical protein
MRRRMIDTEGRSTVGQWQVLIARALAFPLPYRPATGGPIYHLSVDDREVMVVADHDLLGPLSDLLTAVLALGEEMLAAPARHGPGPDDGGAGLAGAGS